MATTQTTNKKYKTVEDLYVFLTGFSDTISIDIQVIGLFRFDCNDNFNRIKVESCDNADVLDVTEQSCRSTISPVKAYLNSIITKKPELLVSIDNRLVTLFNGIFRTSFDHDSSLSSTYFKSKYTEETLSDFIKTIQNCSIESFEKAVHDKLRNFKGLKFFSIGSITTSHYYTPESIKKEYRGLPIDNNDVIEKLFKKTEIRDHFLYICNVDHETLKGNYGQTVEELVEEFKKKPKCGLTTIIQTKSDLTNNGFSVDFVTKLLDSGNYVLKQEDNGFILKHC